MLNRSISSKLLAAATATVALSISSAAFAQVTDGSITTAEYGPAVKLQDTPSGFGDNFSELDGIYTRFTSDGKLNIGLTGNLEGNNNGLVIFIDSRSGGGVATTLPNGYGVLGSIAGDSNAFTHRSSTWGNDWDASAANDGHTGSILSPGFNPERALEINHSTGVAYYINVVDMTQPNDPPATPYDDRATFLPDPLDATRTGTVGGPAVTSTLSLQAGAVNAGTITTAFNNSNTAGVNGFDFGNPPGPLGDPSSANTGFEMQLSTLFLNADPGSEIKLLPFITNQFGDFLSNQFLPGLNGASNLGNPPNNGTPLFDAQARGANAANFYITVPLPEWKTATSGVWSTDANWAVVKPDGVNVTAKFGTLVAGATVTVDGTHTVGGIIFDNPTSQYILQTAGAGTGTIVFDALAGKTARVNVVSGSHFIFAPMTVNKNLRFTVARAQDIAGLAGDMTYAPGTTLLKDGPGTGLVKNVRNDGVTIAEGELKINGGRSTSGTSNVKNLTIAGATNAWTAKLDLADQDMVVDYTGASPQTTIANQVKSGFAGGQWNGNGINSGVANFVFGQATNNKTAIGYAEASDVHDFNANPSFTFSGQSVDSTSVLLRYTYYGDSNLDGKVDSTDFNALASNFGQSGKLWVSGDYNFDGNVDSLDFNGLATNFGQPPIAASGASPLGATVPEPATVALLAVGLGATSIRRRRR